MQFRSGVLYIVLFAVIAAGAYAVIATADAPEATVEAEDADEQLAQGDNLTVGDRTYNVSELGENTGTTEYVNESAVLEATWEDGDAVTFEENGTEYTVIVGSDGGNETDGNETTAGNESANTTSVTLRENFDEGNLTILEDDDGNQYVQTEENGTVPIDEYEGIDSRTYETGDAIEFYHEDSETVVEAEITAITDGAVTVEWTGTNVATNDLEQGVTVTLNGEEFVAYFPGDGQVYLSSDVDGFESQQADADAFDERLTGLWWVVVIAVTAMILLAAMAFMPRRS